MEQQQRDRFQQWLATLNVSAPSPSLPPPPSSLDEDEQLLRRIAQGRPPPATAAASATQQNETYPERRARERAMGERMRALL
jgi:hypothetical protein